MSETRQCSACTMILAMIHQGRGSCSGCLIIVLSNIPVWNLYEHREDRSSPKRTIFSCDCIPIVATPILATYRSFGATEVRRTLPTEVKLFCRQVDTIRPVLPGGLFTGSDGKCILCQIGLLVCTYLHTMDSGNYRYAYGYLCIILLQIHI